MKPNGVNSDVLRVALSLKHPSIDLVSIIRSDCRAHYAPYFLTTKHATCQGRGTLEIYCSPPLIQIFPHHHGYHQVLQKKNTSDASLSNIMESTIERIKTLYGIPNVNDHECPFINATVQSSGS